MTISQEIKDSFVKGGILTKLIYINLVVFVLVRLVAAGAMLANTSFTFLNWIAVPSSLYVLKYEIWTPITYMFVHYDFIHILFNMLNLYWFGIIFLRYYSQKQLLGVYFIGGLLGALFFIVSYNVFPGLKTNISIPMIGASASIMAIVWAGVYYNPSYKINLMFIGPVKVVYLGLFFFIIDLVSISSFSNTGGHISHIGGAVFGILYAMQMKKGKDLTQWIIILFDKIEGLFVKKSKMHVSYNKYSHPLSDMEYNAQKRKKEQNIDKILDKIKRSGYDSLSKKEKKDLFDAGK